MPHSLTYLFQRWVLRRRVLTAHARELDLRVRFKAADVMGRHIFKYGIHEPDLTGFLSRFLRLRDGDVFLDIGANLGWYSLLVGRHQPPGVRIVCFEPDPETFDLLQQNLRLNGLSRVDARRLAVSDESSRRTLFRYADKNTGRHSLLAINDGDQVEVETVTLTRFLASEGIDVTRLGLVKIDVEGFEPFVLKGMAEVLPALPMILAEYAPVYLRRGGVARADYLDPLFEAGFVPCEVDRERLTPLDRAAVDRIRTTTDLAWLNARMPDRWPLAAEGRPALASPDA